jgi:hypothetical protein
VVLQTLLRARVTSRTQSWGEGALPEAGERFVSAELGRYRLSSLSGCCPTRMLQCAQNVNPKTCDRLKITGLHSGQVGRRFTMGSVKRIRFLNFSQAFGSGFYPEGAENPSIDSIIFKCASDVAPQSKDRTAETEAYPAALYQRPS